MNPFHPSLFPLWIRLLERLLGVFKKRGYRIRAGHTAKFDELHHTPYDHLRETICSGDLLFCGGEYAFSQVIRYFSGGSRLSHVGIVYWWNGRLMLLESVESDGARIVPVSQYLRNYENSNRPYRGRFYLARDDRIYQGHQGLDNPQIDDLLSQAASLLNKKFAFSDLAAFFWKGATGRGAYPDNDYFLCSEFVAKCFGMIGLDCPSGDGSGFVTPEDIASAPYVRAICEIVDR